jgi:hypothetical protein
MDDPAAAPPETQSVEPEVAEDGEVKATGLPTADKETGVATYGEFPLNHRLRAEALAKAKLEKDPDGIVTPELIVDAGERLEREAKAEEEAKAAELAARPPVNKSMKRDALDKIARDEDLDPAAYSNIPDLVDAIEAKRAADPASSNETQGS